MTAHSAGQTIAELVAVVGSRLAPSIRRSRLAGSPLDSAVIGRGHNAAVMLCPQCRQENPPAGVATQAREASRQYTAGEKLTKLAFDETRQPVATATAARLGQKRRRTQQRGARSRAWTVNQPAGGRSRCEGRPLGVGRLAGRLRQPGFACGQAGEKIAYGAAAQLAQRQALGDATRHRR